MATCEMCGKETTALKASSVAGSNVMVCSSCCVMGTMKKNSERKSHSFKKHKHDELNLEVASNYAQIIQQGINRKHLTPHQVARAVNVKESSLSHYLKGQIKPDILISKKFESFLGIKLVFEVEGSSVNVEDFKVTPDDNEADLSLGDMLLNAMNK